MMSCLMAVALLGGVLFSTAPASSAAGWAVKTEGVLAVPADSVLAEATRVVPPPVVSDAPTASQAATLTLNIPDIPLASQHTVHLARSDIP